MAIVRRQNHHRPRPVAGAEQLNTVDFDTVLGDFERLFSELGSPFYSRSEWAQGYPVDLYETGENVVLEMAVPGIRSEDLDLSIEGRQLTLKGTLAEVDTEGRRYWLQNIPHGHFSRTLNLPVEVDLDRIQAGIENGLLTLTMPKVAEAKARQIEIRGH